MTTNTKSKESKDSASIVAELRSYVPGVAFVPEAEFQELYFLYAKEEQDAGRTPLPPFGFMALVRIELF